jgi:hypothetical protein
MTDRDYIARLQRHLAEYKSRVLLVEESGTWGTPPRPYAHILPRERQDLNIVASFRQEFWRAQRQYRWKLHKYFHHLSSSQAFAFNVFLPLFPEVPAGLVATRRLLGLPESASAHLEFERILDAKEGTNIDVLICCEAGARSIIEVKLTEQAFGNAVPDERHLAKLDDIYKPLLAEHVDSSCLEPSAFFRDYQLYRNLAQVRHDSADSVVLLIPKARTQLWQHACNWCDSARLGSLLGRIRPVAIEDLIATLIADLGGGDHSGFSGLAEVSHKYILPAR